MSARQPCECCGSAKAWRLYAGGQFWWFCDACLAAAATKAARCIVQEAPRG